MCAKKNSGSHRSWKLAGEPLRPQSLDSREKEIIAENFSRYTGAFDGTAFSQGYMNSAETKIVESATKAIAGLLCEYFSDRFARGAVVTALAVTASIPVKLSAQVGRRPDYLMGAALWFLDYLEETCDYIDEYLLLLPSEPDPMLEFRMPYAEDLSHSRDLILRMATVLMGREKEYRQEFQSLMDMIDEDTAANLRTMFKDMLLDYMGRALKVCDYLSNIGWTPTPMQFELSDPPDFFEASNDNRHPAFRFLIMAPELVCRPASTIRKELRSRKAAELLSSYSTADPYALCISYFLLEREKDVLASLNVLSAVVMICATHHLPWAQDEIGARAGMFESGAPDYRRQYVYREQSEEEGDGEEAECLLSESQLFYIATGVVPPRNQRPSNALIHWFMDQGVEEQRARELAWGALYAFHVNTEAGDSDIFDWRSEMSMEGEEIQPPETQPLPTETEKASAVQGEQEAAAQIEQLTKQLKKAQSAWHDSERATTRLKEQLREKEQKEVVDRAELAQLRETLYQLRAGEDAVDEDNGPLVDLPWQVKRQIVVFGGHDSWRKAVRPLLPGARFYDREVLPDPNTIRGAETVWLQVNAMSHTYYYRIIDVARKYDIPVRYFGSASAKKCALQLALDELAVERSREK